MRWFDELTRPAKIWLKRRFVSRGLILIYHRVADDPIDPWGLCVSAEKFAAHMRIIRQLGFRTVHVSQLADDLRGRRLPRRTVAVTFDDGYADNLDAARPILERHQMPASHYATAGYIGSDEPFWWDVLDIVFLRTKQLPESLSITLAGEQHHWTLGEQSVLKNGNGLNGGWSPLSAPQTRRQEIHDSVWRLLAGADPAERQQAIRKLLDWAELPRAVWMSARPMSEDELRALRGDGLVEIGAHSLTHPALSSLPRSTQTHELAASKARLEQILGTRVRGCTYPLGRTSPELGTLARDVGYDFACGSTKRAVDWRSDLFLLPRVSIKNWDKERFKALLDYHIAA